VVQSSNPSSRSSDAAGKVVLLARDRELSAFGEIIDELGLPIERCVTGLPDEEQFEDVVLVVATAQRLLESSPPHLSCWPPTIVVVQDTSKTLSAHLHRIGASTILRQPVHPQALRLLLLHSIYHGPERRTRQRTPIGHRVRVGSGLFKHTATLLELSPSGARIEIARTPKLGTALRVQLGRELTLGRPINLSTKVVRQIDKPVDADQGLPEIGLSILNASEHMNTIQAIIDRHSNGPAVWKTNGPKLDTRRGSAHDSRDVTIEGGHVARLLAEKFDRDGIQEESRESNASQLASSERRAQPRVPYSRRIVALDEEAARVLIGCDLSPGGMRVISNEGIVVGDVMKVALHCGNQLEPLVVMVRALRDDPKDGLVLGFENLSERQREHLEKIITESGTFRATQTVDSAETNQNDALVVGAVLESRSISEATDHRPETDTDPPDQITIPEADDNSA
jgi:hypothetical protein